MVAPPPSKDQIFNTAAELADPAERADFLNDVCAHNPELRAEIEDLLRRDSEEATFLESPPPGLGACRTIDHPLAEKSGTLIGRYKLLELIGEGGFGAVYLAEQAEPVRRQVALKIIKLGMDTQEVVARFEAERQAVALMDHPNIAKVYDAGATQTGRPYFVMELARGVPITQHCDQANLTLRQRLALFIDVCHAMQHAHQRGIIHRDIKPTNVIVTLLDGQPVPKVIDFGIAKATQQRLTEKTLSTQFGQLIGTPQYMSPEQAEFSAVDVDTRTDVYSLGVVLYELLTGTTPFHTDELRRGGYDELCRIIRETDPPTPSKRVSTLRAATTEVAKHRQAQPAVLQRELRGDLDWIVMKALEKDLRDRYASAQELADDLQRHLENKPITAKKPSALQRLSKWSRRHAPVVLSAAVVLVLVALVSTVSALMLSQAYRKEAVQRQRAEEMAALLKAQREKALQKTQEAVRKEVETSFVLGFLTQDLLGSPPPEADSAVPKRIVGKSDTLEFVLAKSEKRIDTEFDQQPLAEAAARHTLGVLYNRLGQYEAAERHLVRARALRIQELGPWQQDTGQSLIQLSEALLKRGRQAEVLKLAEETLQSARQDAQSKQSLRAWNVLFELADLLEYDAPDVALTIRKEGLAVQRRILGPEHPDTLGSMNSLATAFYYRGNLKAARKLWEETLSVRRRIRGPEHSETLDSMNNLALVLELQGDLKAARKLCEETLSVRRRTIGPEDEGTLTLMNNLAAVLLAQGDLKAAQKLYEETLSVRRRTLGPENEGTLILMDNLGVVLCSQGNVEEARKLHENALEVWRRTQGPKHPHTLISMSNLGFVLCKQGNLEEARKLLENALNLQRHILGPEHPDTLASTNKLADVLREQDELEEARKLLQNVVEVHRRVLGPEHRFTLGCMSNLARLLGEQGEFEEARKLHEEVLAARLRVLRAEDRDTLHAMGALAWFLVTCPDSRFHDIERAVELSTKVVQMAPQDGNFWNTLGVVHYRTGQWKESIAALNKSLEISHKRNFGSCGFFLAMANWQLGQKDEAHRRWNEAVAWMDERCPNNHELIRFRAEAAALMDIADPARQREEKQTTAPNRR